MRAVFIFLVSLFPSFAVMAQDQDCDCGKPYFVFYELIGDKNLEIDGNPWRVAVITHYDADMTQSEEPEICDVILDLIPDSDPILFKDFEEIPIGDFEVNYEGKWMLASAFEKMMSDSQCLTGKSSS